MQTQDTRTKVEVASFTVPGEPVSKARARFTKRGSKTVAYTPQKTLDGEDAVKAAFLKVTRKRGTDKEAAYAVRVHFFNGTRQRRDIDNMVKLILDGLNKVAYPDDNQVLELTARKSFVGKSEARTEVQVFLIGEMEYPSRPCAHCGKLFRVYESTPDRETCSMGCLSARRAESRMCTCKHCGIEFDGRQQVKKPVYCSMECKSLDLTAEVDCTQCSGLFRRPVSMAKVAKRFCSTECRAEFDLTCTHGHPWSEHLKRRPNGNRFCGECNRIRALKLRGQVEAGGSELSAAA